MADNYYKTLGLDYHPNHDQQKFDEARQRAKTDAMARFANQPQLKDAELLKIENAYGVLSDPERRRQHDAQIPEDEKAAGIRKAENEAYNESGGGSLRQQIYKQGRIHYKSKYDVSREKPNQGNDPLEFLLIETFFIVRAPDYDVWLKHQGRGDEIYTGEKPSLADRGSLSVGTSAEQQQGWNELLGEYRDKVSITNNPDGSVQSMKFTNPEERANFLRDFRERNLGNLNDAPAPDTHVRPRLN